MQTRESDCSDQSATISDLRGLCLCRFPAGSSLYIGHDQAGCCSVALGPLPLILTNAAFMKLHRVFVVAYAIGWLMKLTIVRWQLAGLERPPSIWQLRNLIAHTFEVLDDFRR